MLAQAFPALGGEPKLEEYWEGVFAVVPDRKPRLMRLAPGIVFGGIYSGRGVALSLSLGRKMGQWAAGTLSDDDMPLPVTSLRLVPMQPAAVQVARHIHPWHRIQDRFS
jgi:glycine/D-amino acid oxidase-like deaminating enzyme